MSTLADQLSESAARYARRALSSYLDEEAADFFVFAGFAIEHQLKYRLVWENPAYIGPRDDFVSTVALARAHGDASRLPTGTRTIGAKESLGRAEHIIPALSTHRPGVQELFAYRNGEAHLASVDTTTLRRGFVSLLRAMDLLRTVSAEELWKGHTGFVNTTLSEDVEGHQKHAALKIAAARQRFAERNRRLSNSEIEALAFPLRIHRDQLKRSAGSAARAVVCPICASPAIAFGESQFEEHVEGGDDDVSFSIDFTFWAHRLECSVCGVDLEG